MKKLGFLVLGLLCGVSLGVVNAGNYVTTVPGLVVTGEQDGQVFEYGVLKFDDRSGHVIMLLDRNLGATMTGAGSDANTGSYGFKYQWGNNHGFADGCRTNNCSDSVTENSTGTKVEYNSGYENSNYSGFIFIKSEYQYGYNYWIDERMRNEIRHNNIRGGGGDKYENQWGLLGKTEQSIKNRQGPCPEGYHVPSHQERINLSLYWYNAEMNGDLSQQQASNQGIPAASGFAEAMYIPYAGLRDESSAKLLNFGNRAMLWTSSPSNPSSWSSMVFEVGNNIIVINYGSSPAVGFSVRCFDDSYLFPEYLILFYDGDAEVRSGTVKEGNIWTGSIAAPDVMKDGYEFAYRHLTGVDAEFDFTNTTITGNIKLYAKRTAKEYTIDYELNDGVISGENATGYTIESEDITLINPTKIGYTFTGRSGTSLNSPSMTVTIPSGSTGDRNYEANWQINQYTIIFDTDGGTNIPSITADYGTGITAPANPTKNGYTFKGWDKEIPTTMPAENITIKAKWEKNGSSGGGGGGGGGSSSSKDEQKPAETLKDQTSSGTTVKEPKTTTGSKAEIETGSQQPLSPMDNSPDREQTVTPLIGGDGEARGGGTQSYSPEFQEAYEFAHEKRITTMPTIEKANMNGKLTRIAMAKMLSQYAMNVLGQKPDETINNKFNDVTDKQNSDYDDGVTLVYQLGIMGQNMPGNNFRPNDEVTRGEFVTALSRMLYNTSDGEYKSTPKYYIHHMEKMKEEGIVTKDDPAMKELRGYVMIMLMRSAK